MDPVDELYAALLILLGVSAGVTGTTLLATIAPSMLAPRPGISPVLNGAVLGGATILFLALAIAFPVIHHHAGVDA